MISRETGRAIGTIWLCWVLAVIGGALIIGAYGSGAEDEPDPACRVVMVAPVIDGTPQAAEPFEICEGR